MKISLRYLSSKSPLSERRLTIAALKVFECLMFYFVVLSLSLWAKAVQKADKSCKDNIFEEYYIVILCILQKKFSDTSGALP